MLQERIEAVNVGEEKAVVHHKTLEDMPTASAPRCGERERLGLLNPEYQQGTSKVRRWCKMRPEVGRCRLG
jgi:hypothetical protein